MLQLNDYLKKLDLAPNTSPSLSRLKQLQASHVERIPWENLDIFFKRKLTLNLENIIKKFIDENRGGICFELNGAYHQLLCELGYNAKLVAARIFGFNDKQYQTPRDTHIVILVELNNHYYLTDVAWDGFRNPLPLSGEIVNDISGSHRIRADASNQFFVEKQIADQWHVQYQFFDDPISLFDVTPHLDYHNTNPEREAANQLLYKKHTSTGYVSLVDDQIIYHEKNLRKEYSLSELGGLKKVFIDIFHLKNDVLEKFFIF